ncbi:MAG: biotin carboxylase N-terminal domain-containing protein, partial [Bacteriovoracaceae bacterium]
MKKFSKVLIANRGEIAIRVLRSCKELGIQTVSVHSEADEDSLHVKLADESVCIGPAKSALSYLNIPSILSAAEITGADAIHPGYGFLAENEEFARMCQQWKVSFIGPKIDCIHSMGDKIESKLIAKDANVPTLEPIYVNRLDDDEILAQVEKMGFPIIIKASAGGGGRGMRKVEKLGDVLKTVEVLKKEAKAGFGDETLFIEKYIESPRHIEVQILADRHGNIIHLGERDCTIQRRFQKVIEESPSPVLSIEKRE